LKIASTGTSSFIAQILLSLALVLLKIPEQTYLSVILYAAASDLLEVLPDSFLQLDIQSRSHELLNK